MYLNRKVSVIIPVYNHENYLSQSILSVLSQTYPLIELIVINDGSTDNSHGAISSLLEEHAFVYINQANKGLSATLQYGLELCTGGYVAILASDDKWTNTKVEEQIKYLDENTSCVACCAQVNIFDENSNLVADAGGRSSMVESYDFNRIMIEGHNIPPATILIRREKISEQSFKVDFKVEDLFLWLSITRGGGTIDVLPQVLASYRIHSGNTTGNLALIAKFHHMTIDLFRDTDVYDESKVAWRRFSFRQLSRRYKKEALGMIVLDSRFILSKDFLIGIVKILISWR